MSNEKDELSPAERELEAALGGLAPAAPPMGLEQAYVRAAVARERRRTRLWQGVAAVLAVGAGVAVWNRPAATTRVVEVQKVVYVESTKPAAPQRQTGAPQMALVSEPAPAAPGDYAYLRMRDRVLTQGVDSLRVSRVSTPSPRVPQAIGEGTRIGPQPVEMPWVMDFVLSGGRS
jgi:hypothetical protein